MSKNLATIFCGHSLAEAMFFLGMQFFGLIRTNHCRTPSFRNMVLNNGIICVLQVPKQVLRNNSKQVAVVD